MIFLNMRRRAAGAPKVPIAVISTLAALSCLCLAAPVVADVDVQPPVSKGQVHFDERDGASLYRGVCQGCHMDEGQGARGAAAYPALKANPRLAAAAYPIYNILHGRNGMPPVGKYMNDEQVAAVVNYVRSHFDNHYTDQVSAEDVKRLR